jgi:valyl-tRNA synthetase
LDNVWKNPGTEKEKAKLEGEIKRGEGKLNNKGFTDKAPEKVVAAEKEKLEKYKDMYNKIIERIEQLKK